jgi:hypothetical protein
MTTRIASVIGLVLVSWVAVLLLSVSMLYIPGTPFRRAVEHIQVLEKYRNAPDDPGAGAAFYRFLELGRQVEWFEATVISMSAGLVVACAARLRGPLAAFDFTSVLAGFALGRVWLRGQSVADPTLLAGVACFGVCLAAGEWLRRAKAVRSTA